MNYINNVHNKKRNKPKIIQKIFVINLKERDDRWEQIRLDFLDTQLELTRWNAINGKKLTDKEFANLTTSTCKNICSPSMVGCWLSHYTLWKHIVNNKISRALILEDDAYPLKNFKKQLLKLWKQIPQDWDMVYLGCYGSCENTTAINMCLKMVHTQENVYINKNVIRPGFPIGAHAYMLSLKGAKKLINHPAFKDCRARYHIDYILTKHVLTDPTFKVYSFTPPLILQHTETDYSDNRITSHEMFDVITNKIVPGEYQSLESMLNTQLIFHKSFNVGFTFYTIILLIIAFILGVIRKKQIMVILILLQLGEMAFTNSNKGKIKLLLLESLFMLTMYNFGSKIKNI